MPIPISAICSATPLDELHGKELWEIGFFKDRQANQSAYNKLRRTGYIRYDHLPLQSKAGADVAVEFRSNSYLQTGTELFNAISAILPSAVDWNSRREARRKNWRS